MDNNLGVWKYMSIFYPQNTDNPLQIWNVKECEKRDNQNLDVKCERSADHLNE